MTPAREYATALGALAVAAAVMLAALGQVWVRATVGGGEQPRIVLSYTGRQLLPVAAGAAILLLAGIAGVIATRRIGRTIVAVVLVCAALVAGGAALRYGLDPAAAGRQRAINDSGLTEVVLSVTSWWLMVALSAAVAALAAVAGALRGSRWPTLGRRYERPGSARVAPDVMTPAQAWDALDRGEDPTRASEVTE